MMRIKNVPPRIVLSRKGFDSSAGGCASPILNGEMISLPIPEHNLAWRTAQTIQCCPEEHLTYHDLSSMQGKKVANLVAQLTNGKTKPSACVHLDPDIRRELRDTRDIKLPLTFGQDGGSQSELRDLRDGDLFLFFGWFRDAHEFPPASYSFSKDGPDIHAIWGWLQIADRLDLTSHLSKAQKIASHHPHVSHPEHRKANFLYVASETLTFLPCFAGAGIFRGFHDGLCLSDGQTNSRSRRRLRTNWRLPAFFRHVNVTHIPHLSEWELVGESILGKAAYCPGQEFIFETKGHENDVAKWLESIFSRKQRQLP